jgi:hypothetical protein
VHGQVGTERGAGEREHRVAGAVADIGVLVGEGLPVGAHDDDVPGGGQVGLEVAQRLARVRIGEAEGQVAGRAGLRLPVQLDVDAVDGDGPRPRGDRPRGRCRAGDRDELPVVDVGHLPVAAELGVHDVPARGREGHLDGELARGSGGCGVHVHAGFGGVCR